MSPRRLTLFAGLLLLAGLFAAPPAPAQAPPPPGSTTARRDPTLNEGTKPAGGQTGGGGPEIVIESDHNYWIDAGIFVILSGGALFLVCRSAGRV